MTLSDNISREENITKMAPPPVSETEVITCNLGPDDDDYRIGEKDDSPFVESSITANPTLPDTKQCKFCAEEIKREAKICRFCNRDQVEEVQSRDLRDTTKVMNQGDVVKQAIDSDDFIRAISLLPPKFQATYQAEADRRRRGAGIAYICWLLIGWLGAHKFYIGEIGWGSFYLLCTLLCIFTCFFSLIPLIVGLFFDMFLIPSQVDSANNRIRKEILREIAHQL